MPSSSFLISLQVTVVRREKKSPDPYRGNKGECFSKQKGSTVPIIKRTHPDNRARKSCKRYSKIKRGQRLKRYRSLNAITHRFKESWELI